MTFNFLDNPTKEQYKKLLLVNQELVMENHELKKQNHQLANEIKQLQQTMDERDLNFKNYILKLTTSLDASSLIIKELQAKIIELERRLNMNSNNSSMPPSSDKKFDKKIKKDDDDLDDNSSENAGAPKKKMNLLEKLQVFACDTTKPLKFTARGTTVLETLLLSRALQIMLKIFKDPTDFEINVVA